MYACQDSPFAALSAFLILFAAVCPISQSATYVPVAGLIIASLFAWAGRNALVRCLEQAKVPLTILLVQVLWQFATRMINGKPLIISPVEKALNLLPIFFLWALPYDKQSKVYAARKAIFTLLAVSLLIVLLGIFQKTTGIALPLPRQPMRDGAFYGFFDHYIHAGSFFSAVAVFSLCLLLFWKTTVMTRVGLGVVFVILVTGTVLSFTRTYYIALVITILLILIRKSLRTAALGTGLIAVAAALVFSLSPLIRDRALSIFDLKVHQSNVERLHIFKVARGMVVENPIAGVGYREWSNALTGYTSRYGEGWNFTPAISTHAHNVYMMVAAETGLVGLMLFGIFWLYLFWKLLHTHEPRESFQGAVSIGAAAALFLMFVGGLFDDNLEKTLNLFLMIFFISIAFFLRETDCDKNSGTVKCR